MKLTPKSPPGRRNRKARAFADEIARLRKDGYTCDAIREALGDAGILVSRSTVQRELARLLSALPTGAGAASSGTLSQRAAASVSIGSVPSALTDPSRSGKDIAESFVNGRITNPLIRTRNVT